MDNEKLVNEITKRISDVISVESDILLGSDKFLLSINNQNVATLEFNKNMLQLKSNGILKYEYDLKTLKIADICKKLKNIIEKNLIKHNNS
jgi:hypothetical protein